MARADLISSIAHFQISTRHIQHTQIIRRFAYSVGATILLQHPFKVPECLEFSLRGCLKTWRSVLLDLETHLISWRLLPHS